MKLRSEMVFPKGCKAWVQGEIMHDAAAAHALLQAMKEHDALFGGETNETTKMKERAADLMAEWGFSSSPD